MKRRIFQYLIINFSITAYLILVIKLYSVEFKTYKTNSSIYENSPEGKSVVKQNEANHLTEIELFSNELNSKQEISSKSFIDAYDIKHGDNTLDAATVFYSIIMMYPPVDGYEKMIKKQNQAINSRAKHKNRGAIISSGYGD